MLAARDQENVIHARQQAAASKPLNQAPRTPVASGTLSSFTQHLTTRRKAKGDENKTTFATGKKNVAGNQAGAFTTPAPPNRAPLGAKTTNARARPLQTQGFQTAKAQICDKSRQLGASARKTKLKIHHQPDEDVSAMHLPDVRDESDTDSVPEIESCPAKAADLPDYPDPDDPLEIKPDEDFSMFAGRNYIRGAWDVYGQRSTDGLSNTERETTRLDAIERHLDGLPAVNSANDDDFLEVGRSQTQHSGKTSERRSHAPPAIGVKDHNTLCKDASSHSAAVALSNKGDTFIARYARPTLSTQARNPTKMLGQASKAASGPSKTTIGYSKGRTIATTLKKSNERGERQGGKEMLVHKTGEELLDELCSQQYDEERRRQDLFDSHLGIDFDPLADQFKDFRLEEHPTGLL